jgi:hypothetical protein
VIRRSFVEAIGGAIMAGASTGCSGAVFTIILPVPVAGKR